jgi:hypothetical protein
MAYELVQRADEKISGVKTTKTTKRHNYLVSLLEDDLRARSIPFESIVVMPITSRTDEDLGATSIQVLGVRSDDGLMADHTLDFRSDGTATTTVSFPSPGADGTIARRNLRPGFKMSYKVLENHGPELDRDAANSMGVNFGRDWELRTAIHADMDDYFGRAELTANHVVAFRITPVGSLGYWGYEDVDACGVIS